MRLGAGEPRRWAEAVGVDEVRRQNLSAMLRLLHYDGPATRSDLVAATNLNRSTVGALTTELEALQVVRERPGERRGKGRPSIVVEPWSSQVYAVAVDVTSSGITAAAVGLGGYMLQVRRRLHDRVVQDADAVIASIVAIVRDVLRRAKAGAVCVGLGVAVPGSVRQPDGLVHRAPSLGWYEVPLAEHLTAMIGGGLPVSVGNDGDLGAVAEYLRGAARGRSNVLYVRGQAGVGGGIIVEGELLRGAGGYAGEVGHTLVRPRGRPCSCGSRGCWETEVNDAAIVRAAGRDHRQSEVDDVVNDVALGHRRAVAGVRRIGEQVGVGLVSLINVFNPEVVVLGGSFGSLYPEMETSIHAGVAASLGPNREQVHIVRSALGADAQIVGAAEAAFADVLDSPAQAMRMLTQPAPAAQLPG